MADPRETLIAWASSGGFAAVHNAGAIDAQIVDDLLKWLDANGLAIVRLQHGHLVIGPLTEARVISDGAVSNAGSYLGIDYFRKQLRESGVIE